MNKKDLPVMYSTMFWCLLVVLLDFLALLPLTTVTPFIRRYLAFADLSILFLLFSTFPCNLTPALRSAQRSRVVCNFLYSISS